VLELVDRRLHRPGEAVERPSPIPSSPSSVARRTTSQFFQGFPTTYVSTPVNFMPVPPCSAGQ
jgi:hypothetical protein